MKKVFIYLSNFIIAMFFVWFSLGSVEVLQFLSFDSVDVRFSERTEPLNHDEFYQGIEDLAKETDSTIGYRANLPSKDSESNDAQYLVFGDRLPRGIVSVDPKLLETSSMVGSYVIFDGSIQTSELQEFLQGYFGNEVYVYPSTVPFPHIFSLFVHFSILIVLIILSLTFIALSVIEHIADLRNAGIQLVSGKGLREIMFSALGNDVKNFFFASVIAIAVSFIIYLVLNLHFEYLLPVVAAAVGVFSIWLLVLSILTSFVYVIGLKYVSIMSVIKGMLPVMQITAIILVGVFLAMVVINMSAVYALMTKRDLTTQFAAEREWESNSDLFNLGVSSMLSNNTQEGQEAGFKTWHTFFQEAYDEGILMMVHSNMNRYLAGDIIDGISKNDYDPYGRTLYVTPNYFDRAGIDLASKTKTQLAELKQGEYGLLIPDSVTVSEALIAKYQKSMESFGADLHGDTVSYTMNPVVATIASGKSRFLYNQTSMSPEQFVEDPIYVVVTPESTGQGRGSLFLWVNSVGYDLFFTDVEKTEELLLKHGIYSEVGSYSNSAQEYFRQTENLSFDMRLEAIGSMIGLITASILFGTMNLLYFEQFRQQIFLKRIAGMSFGSIHKRYLLAVSAVLLVSFAFNLFFAGQMAVRYDLSILYAVPMVAFLFFAALFSVLLIRQADKENRYAVTVLKGK